MSGSGSGSVPKPPARKKASAALMKGLAKIAHDQERIQELRNEALESTFFDSSSPSTQMRRARARTAFEEYVELVYNVQDVEDIWNSATLVQRTKEFLGAMAELSTGRLMDKVKAGSLWQLKHGMYWWASVLMPDFNVIWQKWHEEVSRHIHYIAVKYDLGTASHVKNNLSDPELALIFRFIMEQDYGIANLKQHWAAMLLAWITGARPGSFTVSKGYRKGTSLGVAGKFRETDETMRWSDVKFLRMDVGISAQITFRFHKGYRNPHKEKQPVNASRMFTLLPTRGERFEFDLSLILFVLAHQRGLFVGSLEDVLAGDEREIPVVPEVDKQAVFVACNQAGALEVDQPMQANALNEKLNKLCVSIGLLWRNTYYSLRRSAIIETRRKHGTEAAKDLAIHKHSADSLFFYDNIGMGDMDINAMRLGEEAGMSRDQVKDFYAQYKTRLVVSPESNTAFDKANLKTIIDKEVKDRLREDGEYIAAEKAHAALLDEASAKLAELQEAGMISGRTIIPAGYSAHKGAKITELLMQSGENELVEKIRDGLKQRTLLLKRIRHRLQIEIRERKSKEHRALLKGNKGSATQVVNPKGRQPRNVTAAGAVDLGNSTQAALDALDDIPGEDDNAEDEGGDVDEEVLEEQDDAANARQEPESWEGLPDNVQIQLGSKEDHEGRESEARAEARLAFLKEFANKRDSDVPLKDLLCPLCAIDPTMKEKEKLIKYSLSKLNYHLTAGTHSREEQLKRAIKADDIFPVICPSCSLPFKNSRQFIKHIKESHDEQLWQDFGNEEEEEQAEGEQGDDGEDAEFFADDDFLDSPAIDQPVPYTGKGKGKA